MSNERVLLVDEGQDIPQALIDGERAAWRRAYALGARADGFGMHRARQLAYAVFPVDTTGRRMTNWAAAPDPTGWRDRARQLAERLNQPAA